METGEAIKGTTLFGKDCGAPFFEFALDQIGASNNRPLIKAKPSPEESGSAAKFTIKFRTSSSFP